jgi:hypothetical protein
MMRVVFLAVSQGPVPGRTTPQCKVGSKCGRSYAYRIKPLGASATHCDECKSFTVGAKQGAAVFIALAIACQPALELRRSLLWNDFYVGRIRA